MSLRTLVGEYHTRTGKVGVKIHRQDDPRYGVTYSYIGEWGAGSGHRLDQMQKDVNYWLSAKRGIKAVVPFAEVALPPGTSRG